MIHKRYSWLVAAALMLGVTSCTDLDEKVYDRIDASTYYQNETSVQGALASIYNQAGNSFAESFFFLQELPADQIAWRVWNGGQWGYDEAEKYVLSTQTWTPESKIIRNSWSSAWSIIG
ncbi:MAG TPA: RagB/SusD family nutrient uptake outer membrane protein, partial [Prevotella sp.]